VSALSVVLSGLLLFQAAALKPVIDNNRVRVWENRVFSATFEYDTVAVTTDGKVAFHKQGSPAVDSRLLVGLKPASVGPLPNSSGFPLAFPREGIKKLLDNAKVTVWDYRWTLGKPTPVHFHDKDVVVMFLEEGDLKSTPVNATSTTNQWKPGTIRFNARDRVHTEELVRGTQRAIIIELK
jgi:hypothetical protein